MRQREFISRSRWHGGQNGRSSAGAYAAAV